MRPTRLPQTLPAGSSPGRSGNRGSQRVFALLAGLGTVLALLLPCTATPASAQGLRDDGPVVAPVELHNPHYSLRDFDEGSERILGEVLRSQGIRALRSAVVSSAVVGGQYPVTTVPYDPRVAAELGAEMQADYVISGALEEYGEGTIRILLVIVDVDTGEIVLEDELSAPSGATGRRGWDAPLRALLEFHGPELADVFRADFEMVLDRRARTAAREEAQRRAEEEIERRRRELEFELLEAEIALKRSERRGADAYRVRQQAEARRAAAEQALAGLRQETAIAARDAAEAARDAFLALRRAEVIRGNAEFFRGMAEIARLDAARAQELAARKLSRAIDGSIPGLEDTESCPCYDLYLDRVVVRLPDDVTPGAGTDLQLLVLAFPPSPNPRNVRMLPQPLTGSQRITLGVPTGPWGKVSIPQPSDDDVVHIVIIGLRGNDSGVRGMVDKVVESIAAAALRDVGGFLRASREFVELVMRELQFAPFPGSSAVNDEPVVGVVTMRLTTANRHPILESAEGDLWVRLRLEPQA